MNPSTQHEKTTQTTNVVLKKKADWIDLSGHESLTPPLQDVEETQEEPYSEDSDEVNETDNNQSKQEDNDKSEQEDNDKSEQEDNDKSEQEDNDKSEQEDNDKSEQEDNDKSEQEDTNEENDNEEETIPGEWVCIIYDRDYWSTTENKYLWTGRVVDENDSILTVDCGVDEGIQVFHKSSSFLDFSRNVYQDSFGWTVRIHHIEYNYKKQRIVDKTAGPEYNAYSIPDSLQIPTVAALGYMFFISFIGPIFHTICQSNDE